METEMKTVELELKTMRNEKDKTMNAFKKQMADKQDELDLVKDQLLKKEGIESKLEEYKAKLEQ